MILFFPVILGVMQMLFVIAFSPLLIGFIRKSKARLQGRVGASVLQPYRDLVKLFHKDEVIARDASWVFRVAPFILFTITLILASAIPILFAFPGNPASDFILIVYLLGFSAFVLALAGLDVGSAFGGFGSSREMTLNVFTEGVVVFSLLPLIFIAETTNFAMMPAALNIAPTIYIIPLVLAFLGFLIALVTENARIPVDNPSTHLELTMIHEAMILEYSGKRLALIEWAAANKLLIFIILGANLFFPFGLAMALSVRALLMAFGVLLLKVMAFALVIAITESTMAKFRIFRVPDFLFAGLILGIIALFIITIL